jgi:hypothetical protein
VGWNARGSNSFREKRFSLLQNIQTSCVAHPTFHSVDTGVLSLEVKRPRREVNLSPPSSAEVQQELRYTCTPPI